MDSKEAALRNEMVNVGRALYDRGLVVATDGNLSLRLDHERLLATPSGLCKGWLRAEELIVVALVLLLVDFGDIARLFGAE